LKQALELLGAPPTWKTGFAQQEGRPQLGIEWIDGLTRPRTLADPEHLNELRGSVGRKLRWPIQPPGPDLSKEEPEEKEATQKWWFDWLVSRLVVYFLVVRSRFSYGVTCSELICTPDCV
jgi:hypothetical protein